MPVRISRNGTSANESKRPRSPLIVPCETCSPKMPGSSGRSRSSAVRSVSRSLDHASATASSAASSGCGRGGDDAVGLVDRCRDDGLEHEHRLDRRRVAAVRARLRACTFSRYARIASTSRFDSASWISELRAGEAEAARRSAGRDDDRLASGRRLRVQRTVERVVLAAVLDRADLRAVGVDLRSPRRDERAVVPAAPEQRAGRRATPARGRRRASCGRRLLAEVVGGADVGHDVEPEPSAAEVLQRGELPRRGVRVHAAGFTVGMTPRCSVAAKRYGASIHGSCLGPP